MKAFKSNFTVILDAKQGVICHSGMPCNFNADLISDLQQSTHHNLVRKICHRQVKWRRQMSGGDKKNPGMLTITATYF